MTVDFNLLRLSAQRALTYNVPRCLRNLSIDVVRGTLQMRAYVFPAPTQDEIDLIYSIGGEIEGDFGGLQAAEDNVEIIVDDGPIGDLRTLRWVVFAMAE